MFQYHTFMYNLLNHILGTCTSHLTFSFIMCATFVGYISNKIYMMFLKIKKEVMREQLTLMSQT